MGKNRFIAHNQIGTKFVVVTINLFFLLLCTFSFVVWHTCADLRKPRASNLPLPVPNDSVARTSTSSLFLFLFFLFFASLFVCFFSLKSVTECKLASLAVLCDGASQRSVSQHYLRLCLCARVFVFCPSAGMPRSLCLLVREPEGPTVHPPPPPPQ